MHIPILCINVPSFNQSAKAHKFNLMKAINPKYQRQVEKAAKLLAKYNDLDNKRNEADGLGDDKLVDKLDKQCERVFNQYLEAEEGLPSREIEAINDFLYN